jgi:hypothetical protein
LVAIHSLVAIRSLVAICNLFSVYCAYILVPWLTT